MKGVVFAILSTSLLLSLALEFRVAESSSAEPRKQLRHRKGLALPTIVKKSENTTGSDRKIKKN